MPAATFRTRLYSKRTCSTTHHAQPPFELRGVSTIAYPGCASFQWFSKMLSSTTTLRAFFNSNRFFTVHTVPGDVGTAPAVPALPVSVNSVPLTVQKAACAPAVRPYTWYSVAPATGCHVSRTALAGWLTETVASIDAVERPIVPCPTP